MNNPADSQRPSDPNKSCIIAAGTLIKGKITTSEDIRIDGTINGEIKTTGRLIIGAKGLVTGKVNTNEIINSGRIKSDEIISNVLTVKDTGEIEGDLKVKRLIVESGAVFNGVSSMEKQK